MRRASHNQALIKLNMSMHVSSQPRSEKPARHRLQKTLGEEGVGKHGYPQTSAQVRGWRESQRLCIVKWGKT